MIDGTLAWSTKGCAMPRRRSSFMYREPADVARAALQDLRDALSQLPAESRAEEIQNVV
jgi:hypothetical protein